jgi:PKD repeat protein
VAPVVLSTVLTELVILRPNDRAFVANPSSLAKGVDMGIKDNLLKGLLVMGLMLGVSTGHATEVITEGNRVVGITDLSVLNRFGEVDVYDVTFVYDTARNVYGDDFDFTFTEPLDNFEETDLFLALEAVTDALNTESPTPTRAGPVGTLRFFIGGSEDSGAIGAVGGEFFDLAKVWQQCEAGRIPGNVYPCFLGFAALPADEPFTYAVFTLSGDDPNQRPVADAGGPYPATIDAEITFDGSGSSDPDGTIATYEWDFGDGSSGTGEQVVHTYTEKGAYQVTLRVTDNAGATGTGSTKAYVAEPSGLSRTLLMRRTDDGRWTHYVLDGFTVLSSGPLDLARSLDYETVSRGDFNGDREDDLLVRDVTGGQNGRWVIYNLVEGQIADGGYIDLPRNADWVLQHVADYDGDGNDDALLRNAQTGAWLLYLLEGVGIKAQGNVAMSNDLGLEFKGSADFDGDAIADVLLRGTDGAWTMYLLNGLSAPVAGSPALPTNAAVDVAALDYFGADAMADILTRRSTDGLWSLFEMNGAEIADSGSVAITRNLAFEVVETADFSADGRADVLLREASGKWSLFELDGREVLASGDPGLSRNPDFAFVEAGRYDADFANDVLLRNTVDGRPALYLMNGVGPQDAGQPGITQALIWQPVVD